MMKMKMMMIIRLLKFRTFIRPLASVHIASSSHPPVLVDPGPGNPDSSH